MNLAALARLGGKATDPEWRPAPMPGETGRDLLRQLLRNGYIEILTAPEDGPSKGSGPVLRTVIMLDGDLMVFAADPDLAAGTWDAHCERVGRSLARLGQEVRAFADRRTFLKVFLVVVGFGSTQVLPETRILDLTFASLEDVLMRLVLPVAAPLVAGAVLHFGFMIFVKRRIERIFGGLRL